VGRSKTLLERAEQVTGLKQDEHGVWRDQWGRPALWRADGKGRAPYKRASKIGEELDKRDLLEAWGERMVAQGVGTNEHLQVAVQSSWRNRDRMNEICAEAKTLAKAKERAVKGTAEHHFFDDIDLGRETDRPRHLDDDAEAYEALTGPRLEHLHVEQFVACDTWLASLPVFIAGRPDRASRLKIDIPFPRKLWDVAGMEFMPAGECVIVDNKTGRSVDFAQLSWGLQLGAYANGDPYDLQADQRFEWIQRPRTDWALVVHTPYGEGESRLYWLNIGKAWTYLAIAIARINAQASKAELMAAVPKAHVIRNDRRMNW
jgi:hypothetical protein